MSCQSASRDIQRPSFTLLRLGPAGKSAPAISLTQRRCRTSAALTPLVTLTRARGPGRGRPAATGSLANAIGRAKTAEGLGRASLRHFGLARGCRGIWRGVISVYWFRGELRFIGFGGAMRLEAIGPLRRCRGGVVSIYWFRRPRVNPSCHPYARARARPWSARCYGVARQRDRSRQNSRGARACISPAFRARAWVPRNLARRKRKTRAIANQSPLLKLSEESDSKERLRVSNWIVQRLYNYAVKKTVEL